jgi:4-hydroxy-tetrahydrodipicolinate synthase
VNFQDIQAQLRTVITIPVTPFASDGSFDRGRHIAAVQRLVAAGLKVITVNGNTSEFYSLSPSEHDAVLAATLEAAAGRALIVASAGHDISSVIRAGRLAQAQDAAAMMIHQPLNPIQSPEGWVDYHVEIAASLPALPLVLYLRSASITAEHLARLAQRCPNIVAVKYAVPDPVRFGAAVAAVPPERLTWVCGLAEMWAPFFWLAGARGFTSGLVNVAAGLPLHMLASLQAGDLAAAQAVANRVRPFEAMRGRDNGALNVSVIKEALALLGLGSRRVRPPIQELNLSQRAEVAAMLPALTGDTSP